MKEKRNHKYEINRLKEENVRLEKENADIQNSHMKLYNDTKDEIRELKAEIERLRRKCGEEFGLTLEKCDEQFGFIKGDGSRGTQRYFKEDTESNSIFQEKKKLS